MDDTNQEEISALSDSSMSPRVPTKPLERVVTSAAVIDLPQALSQSPAPAPAPPAAVFEAALSERASAPHDNCSEAPPGAPSEALPEASPRILPQEPGPASVASLAPAGTSATHDMHEAETELKQFDEIYLQCQEIMKQVDTGKKKDLCLLPEIRESRLFLDVGLFTAESRQAAPISAFESREFTFSAAPQAFSSILHAWPAGKKPNYAEAAHLVSGLKEAKERYLKLRQFMEHSVQRHLPQILLSHLTALYEDLETYQDQLFGTEKGRKAQELLSDLAAACNAEMLELVQKCGLVIKDLDATPREIELTDPPTGATTDSWDILVTACKSAFAQVDALARQVISVIEGSGKGGPFVHTFTLSYTFALEDFKIRFEELLTPVRNYVNERWSVCSSRRLREHIGLLDDGFSLPHRSVRSFDDVVRVLKAMGELVIRYDGVFDNSNASVKLKKILQSCILPNFSMLKEDLQRLQQILASKPEDAAASLHIVENTYNERILKVIKEFGIKVTGPRDEDGYLALPAKKPREVQYLEEGMRNLYDWDQAADQWLRRKPARSTKRRAKAPLERSASDDSSEDNAGRSHEFKRARRIKDVE